MHRHPPPPLPPHVSAKQMRIRSERSAVYPRPHLHNPLTINAICSSSCIIYHHKSYSGYVLTSEVAAAVEAVRSACISFQRTPCLSVLSCSTMLQMNLFLFKSISQCAVEQRSSNCHANPEFFLYWEWWLALSIPMQSRLSSGGGGGSQFIDHCNR